MLLSINNFFSFLDHAHCFISLFLQSPDTHVQRRALVLPAGQLSPKAVFHPTLAVDHPRLLLLDFDQFLNESVSVSFEV